MSDLPRTGNDLDVFLVPQEENADVRGAVEAIRDELNCGVSGPYLGHWNRLSCIIRLLPDAVDAQFIRLTTPPQEFGIGSICYDL